MMIKDLFAKPIDRDIKGVIKVGQDDSSNVRQELEEYVVTRELQKHFAEFFASYKRGILGTTDKMGVWISGFFGSGKSHFLKILSYLLANKNVDGKAAIDYFIDDQKIIDNITLHILTPNSDEAADEPTMRMLSGQSRCVLVVLPNDRTFLDEIRSALKIEKFIRFDAANAVTKFEQIKEAKKVEMRERSASARLFLTEAMREAAIYVNGDRAQSSAKEISSRINDALGKLVAGVYAGGEWDASRYKTFLPDADNCIPVTDEEYFPDDVVGRLVEFVRVVYGADTLEENLDFIAGALGNKGATSREVIRNYFLNDFIKDHNKTYQKRPIYWMFDSGKMNGFKALVYMHRWNADTTGNVRVEYLHRIQRVYESEISRMQDVIDNSPNAREASAAQKRKDKLAKQLKETRDYDAKIAHLALARIGIELDDGVKVNYEKVQTGPDGKKLAILTALK